jgi:hypothetical protein
MLWKFTALPGILPFEVSGTVILLLMTLMLTSSVWHVSQTKAPYLPPAMPHPPSLAHLDEPVVTELWSNWALPEGAAVTVVVAVTGAGEAWPDAVRDTVAVFEALLAAVVFALTASTELACWPGTRAMAAGVRVEGAVKSALFESAAPRLKVTVPHPVESLFVTVTV